MLSEIPRKSIVNTAESRQIFPLRENTLRHVVEGDGRYPRAMTPSAVVFTFLFDLGLQVGVNFYNCFSRLVLLMSIEDFNCYIFGSAF